MSLYTRWIASVAFPAQERLKGHTTVAVRRAMEASQWWPAERLEALQLDRLRKLLHRAVTHSEYYRDAFAAARFDPGAVAALADLRHAPLLTKPLIRANLERIRTRDARGLTRFNTGGSSGEPLIFYLGRERVSHDVAAKWRATRWWGVDIGDPEIVVWGSPIELGAQDRARALRDRLMRTELLPAFDLAPASLDRYVAAIRARRPKMLFGYPSALARIAEHAERKGVRMNDLGVRVAFVTAEKTYDEQRAAIARVFGCAVANGYGGRDAGFIAHECPDGRMHITAEDIVVETVDAGGQPTAAGVAGEIVVTHLATGDFPFIRYRTGDVGVLDTAACPCGRGLPVLKEVQGRTTDFVVAADGTVMHGLALIYVLRELAGVEQFKIVQESVERVRVLVVTTGDFPADGEQRIVAGFRRRLGAVVDVEVERVDAIEPERSGKHRYVVSKVAAAAAPQVVHS